MSRLTRLTVVLCGVAAAASVGAILDLRWFQPDPLRQIGRARRAIEARLTFFDYAPADVTRSGAARIDIDAARTELRRRLDEARTPENLHRLALAEFVAGRTQSARDLLAEASALRPDDDAILTDLAAAEIALGRVADGAEICGRILRRDPAHEAAAFNWALALERLSLRPVAIEAWEKFLAIDPASGWADEAREHLAKLRETRAPYKHQRERLHPGADTATVREIVRQFPQRTRGFAQNYVLPRWLETAAPGDLDLLRTIAAERAQLGDPYLFDIVEHAVTHRTEVRTAIREFTAARAEEEKLRWDAAGERFERAAELLARAGSPLQIGATIYAAQGDYTSGRSEAALARLKTADAALAAMGNRYPTMAAESAWVRALVASRIGEPQASLEAFRFALAEAQRGGEIEHVAALSSMVAWMLDTVGEPEEADRHRVESLRRNEEIRAADDRMYASYVDACYVALRAGRPHVAMAFLDALLPIVDRGSHPLLLAETTAWRAFGLMELGQTEAARAKLAEARSAAMRVEVDAAREFILANIDYTEGRLETRGRPHIAVVHFGRAIRVWERYGWRYQTASGFLARGEAALQMRDITSAERDFRAGVAEMEKQRTKLEEPGVRVAYFERSDRLFDRLIELLVDQGRTADALSFAEQKRARFLLDRVASHLGIPNTPLEAHALTGAVTGPVAILEIALVDRGAELWLVHDGRLTHARSRASRREIEAVVARHLAAIAAHDARTLRTTGRWLYDELLAPLLVERTGISDLVIAPDGALQSFPFATLTAPSGEYLLDAFVLAETPSASIFVRRAKQGSGSGAVAVAQAAPDGFAPLHAAVREARDIGRRLPRARVLIGSEVSPAEFLEAASGAQIVHFAGHADADAARPANSSLLFESPDRNGALRLTAGEIARAHLTAKPLVVLAACSTARGRLRRNEGIDSLAAAFLQAGARGVAATLWDVDDGASSRLFRRFHDELRAGARPADALRAAQRALMNSDNISDRDPAVWGSVSLIGSL